MAKVFFSYSHKDEELRDVLEVHLAMLKRQGLIEALHDRRIVAGEPLNDAIDAYLEDADVILCLLSPDFIASEYCYSREMGRALERQAEGSAQVIPVILRHCDWKQTPLKDLRGTPRDNKPVKAWPDMDEAFSDVASDVRRAIESRSGAPKNPEPFASAGAIGVGAQIAPRPRSANLQIPKSVTDQDRDDHIEKTFEFIVEFFANSLEELQARAPDVTGRVTRLDARRFTAAVYRAGKKVSALTVFVGGGWGHGRGISFNNADTGETKSSNGSFDLPSRGEELRFESLFSQISGAKKLLNHEEVAEAIWDFFISPLQR